MKKLAACLVLCALTLVGCKNGQSGDGMSDDAAEALENFKRSRCESWVDEKCDITCNNVCIVTPRLAKAKIAAKADVNARDKYRATPLMRAENAEVVQLLVDAGANLDDVDQHGYTPLMMAIYLNRDIAVIDALIKAGANVNASDDGDEYAIILAAQAKLDVVKMLIAAGADVNVKNSHGMTALLEAKNLEIAKALIAAGADVNVHTPDVRRTALMGADDVELVRALIDAGADVNATDESSSTALMRAKKLEIAKLLIEAKADVNAKNAFKVTALMATDNVEIAKALVDAGADINAVDKEGKSALMRAKSKEIVKLLADAGADLTLKTRRGADVWECLKDAGMDEETIAYVRSKANL